MKFSSTHCLAAVHAQAEVFEKQKKTTCCRELHPLKGCLLKISNVPEKHSLFSRKPELDSDWSEGVDLFSTAAALTVRQVSIILTHSHFISIVTAHAQEIVQQTLRTNRLKSPV